jgi:hypothetical protein
MRRVCVLLSLSLSAFAVIGCGLGVTSPVKEPPSRALAEGETIGRVERGIDGTATSGDVLTLLSLSCNRDQLTVRTNHNGITATMDCTKQVTQAAVERFLGLQVSITYAGGALTIESATAGMLELPVGEPRVTER